MKQAECAACDEHPISDYKCNAILKNLEHLVSLLSVQFCSTTLSKTKSCFHLYLFCCFFGWDLSSDMTYKLQIWSGLRVISLPLIYNFCANNHSFIWPWVHYWCQTAWSYWNSLCRCLFSGVFLSHRDLERENQKCDICITIHGRIFHQWNMEFNPPKTRSLPLKMIKIWQPAFHE